MKYQSFYSAVAMVTPDMEHEDQVEGSSVTNSVLDLCSSIKKCHQNWKKLTLNSQKYLKCVKRDCEEYLWAVSPSSCISSQTFITAQSWLDFIALIINFLHDLLILCSLSKDTEEIQKDQHTVVIVKWIFVTIIMMSLCGRWGKVLKPRTTQVPML